jgi:group II intron reverse transcriptase/maturase
VLEFAYRSCKANGGSPGADGETFQQIEAKGLGEWLDGLKEELEQKQYKPGAVKRVWIPKPDGKERPLGVPRIRDRVAQMAAVLILEPILEEDFPDEQYGYRPGRSAHDAVRAIHRELNRGRREVVDADLSGYFDSIPHHELLKSVGRRVSDGAMLGLIRQWLEMAVEEIDERGQKRRTTVNKDTGRGTPQGAPISPLLSNLYMRRFILGWKKQGLEERFDSRIGNYADDFVILCRHSADEARERMQALISRLKLKVNETKTRVCRVPEESFDFLGYTIGRQYSPRNGRAYIGTRPSRKRIQRFCKGISELTGRHRTTRPVETLVEDLNLKLKGWANYFCLGAVSKAYRSVDRHTSNRLRQWLRRKHKKPGQGTRAYPDEYLYETLGLFRLTLRTKRLPWAKVA